MATDLDWWPLADEDPVPGSPDAIEELADKYEKIAKTIDSATASLRKLSSVEDQEGEAVDQFRDTAGGVADSIARALERYRATAAALRAYAPELREAQLAADVALVQVRESQKVADQARHSLLAAASEERGMGVYSPPPGIGHFGSEPRALTESGYADEERAQYELCLSAAREQFAQALQDVYAAQERRDEAAETAMRSIELAVAQDQLNDGWAENFAGALEIVLREVGNLVAVAGVAVFVLALCGIGLPFIGLILAGITFGLLLCNLYLYLRHGRDKKSAMATDAITLLTFGVGRAAKGVGRAGTHSRTKWWGRSLDQTKSSEDRMARAAQVAKARARAGKVEDEADGVGLILDSKTVIEYQSQIPGGPFKPFSSKEHPPKRESTAPAPSFSAPIGQP